MNHRFARPALLGVLATLAFTACGVAASRTPLGGNYAIEEGSAARDHIAASAAAVAAPEPTPEPEPTATASSVLAAGSAPAGAGAPSAPNANQLRYDPLKVGDKIKIEFNVSFDLALETGRQAVIPGDGKVTIDAKYSFDLTVTQASAQTLDELEVTVTPLAMRTHFGTHSSEPALDAPEKFQVTLGRSPSIKASGNSTSDEEGRAALLLLCSTLADFHEHWARSPTLELKSSWSSSNAVTVPPLLNSHGETVKIGPLVTKYTGAEPAADRVSFELTLPASYGGAIGKLDFDLKGTARLSTKQARPVAIELTGPASGGGPNGELAVHGFTKFSATLGYP